MEPGEFLETALAEYAKSLEQKLLNSLANKGIGVSDTLKNSIKTQVSMNVSALSGKIELMYKLYGRMRDMNVSRGHNLDNKIESIEGNGRLLKGKSGWYSRTTYGSIYGDAGLIDRIMAGMLESSLSTIKAALIPNP